MSIVTKKGDQGKTQLFSGETVAKFDSRLEAYGTVDELNAVLGLCRAFETNPKHKQRLRQVQGLHFIVCSELATDEQQQHRLKEHLTPEHTKMLESWIVEMEKHPSIFKDWAVAGENQLSSFYELARCVCRRCERAIFAMQHKHFVSAEVLRWINRLSDWIWLQGRLVEIAAKVIEQAKLRQKPKDGFEQA